MSPLGTKLAGFEIDLRRCDGHDLEDLRAAIGPPGTRPVVVILDTIKGKGVRAFEGRMESHYLPLSTKQYEEAMALLEDAAGQS